MWARSDALQSLLWSLLLCACSEAHVVPQDGGGGTDGDSPAVDGGGPDGSDGGQVDAGPDGSDAGPADAGGVDAGGVDAGPRDAGPGVDAGPTATPGVGDLVISEVMADSDVILDDCGEWFELHNPSTDTSYDLLGCTLHDAGNSTTVTTSFVIPPGAYVSLARYSPSLCDPMGFTGPGFTPDYGYGATLKFSNDGDIVWVSCGTDIVDRVDYIGWTITKGASFNLDPDTLDAASNDAPSNWCPAVTVYHMSGSERDRGTPGMPNTDCL